VGFQRPVGLEPHHRADHCSCGVRSLDEWLRRHALQSHRSGGSRVFVTTADDRATAADRAPEAGRVTEAGRTSVAGGEIVGYYALAAGAVMPREASSRVARGLATNQPVPVILLGRLAVDRRCQGRQLGRSLLQDAMTRVLQAGQLIGVRALLVHAIDERARAWYAQFGFVPSPTHSLHLTLLMKDLRATVERSPG
jgi:GNAT superfamily N-acetyltransferase